MREKTYHLYLNEEERSRVIQSLIELKNNLAGTMVFFHPEIRRKRLPYAETSLVAKNIFPS